jgi:glycerol-3-phosphate acyltransferase PlsY
MITVIFILVALQAYLLGSIPFGLLVSRSQGIDIRTVGSGNIGATNVWRFVGRKWGLITFIADAFKGWLAVIIGYAIASRMVPPGAARPCLLWHRGRDRVHHRAHLPDLARLPGRQRRGYFAWRHLWDDAAREHHRFRALGIVFKVTGYVSLASIVAAFALPVIVIGLLFTGGIHGWANFLLRLCRRLARDLPASRQYQAPRRGD